MYLAEAAHLGMGGPAVEQAAAVRDELGEAACATLRTAMESENETAIGAALEPCRGAMGSSRDDVRRVPSLLEAQDAGDGLDYPAATQDWDYQMLALGALLFLWGLWGLMRELLTFPWPTTWLCNDQEDSEDSGVAVTEEGAAEAQAHEGDLLGAQFVRAISSILLPAVAGRDWDECDGILTDAWTIADSFLNDHEQKPPMHWTAVCGCARVVPGLVSAGAEVASPDYPLNPVSAAAEMGHAATVTALLLAGFKSQTNGHSYWNITALHCAAHLGRADAIRAFAAAGFDCDPGVPQDAAHRSGEYLTPLQVAAGMGRLEAVEALLQEGVYPNALANGGRGGGALHLAATMGHTQVIQALIRGGADKDARAGELWRQRTPLHTASWFSHLGCVEELLRLGADPTVEEAGDDDSFGPGLTALQVVGLGGRRVDELDQGSEDDEEEEEAEGASRGVKEAMVRNLIIRIALRAEEAWWRRRALVMVDARVQQGELRPDACPQEGGRVPVTSGSTKASGWLSQCLPGSPLCCEALFVHMTDACSTRWYCSARVNFVTMRGSGSKPAVFEAQCCCCDRPWRNRPFCGSQSQE